MNNYLTISRQNYFDTMALRSTLLIAASKEFKNKSIYFQWEGVVKSDNCFRVHTLCSQGFLGKKYQEVGMQIMSLLQF